MTIEFHPLAQTEVAEAMEKYAEISDELAIRFVDEIDTVMDEILEHPQRWGFYEPLAEERRWRRRRTTGFPYVVIYEVRGAVIRVIAVPHASRRPGYWIDRG